MFAYIQIIQLIFMQLYLSVWIDTLWFQNAPYDVDMLKYKLSFWKRVLWAIGMVRYRRWSRSCKLKHGDYVVVFHSSLAQRLLGLVPCSHWPFCPFLLFFVTHKSEHFCKFGFQLFMIAWSRSDWQTCPTYCCWLEIAAGFAIYFSAPFFLLKNHFSCFVKWMCHILNVSFTSLYCCDHSTLLTCTSILGTVLYFMLFPPVSELTWDLLGAIMWIPIVF